LISHSISVNDSEYPIRRAAWETLVAWDVYQQDGPEKPNLEPATRNDK
jgi:hypothetical protein